jgi:16S rRNA (uracil1498-N3)-methyltransferase
MRRLVVPPEVIQGRSARLVGAHRHHLVDVLRLRTGSPVLLLDGSGRAFRGRLSSVGEAEARVSIEEELAVPPPARPTLTLIYGLSRRARTEWVLQKATELGADAIALAECRRSVARSGAAEKRARWEELLRQAARQCGRARLPELTGPCPLGETLARAANLELKLIAHPGGEPLSALRRELGDRPPSVALAVGPEGGFCEEELGQAAGHGFRTVSLGPLVLRTETAALVLLALAAFLSGRLEDRDGVAG